MTKIRADIKKSLRNTNKINMQCNKKNKKNYEKVAKEFAALKSENNNESYADLKVLLVLSLIMTLYFIYKNLLM